MVTRYFLGANTGAGFCSLYDGFAYGANDFLHVIKGGPGGGKSGLMKRIGGLCEARGLDVLYIQCSGDPASLDGVYVPELHKGWVDGTAPHVIEPAVFGATGTYTDLGAFCNVSTMWRWRGEIAELTARHKERYALAYSRLRSAAALASESLPGIITPAEREAVALRAHRTAERELPRGNDGTGKAVLRFISAHTCDGLVLLRDTITTLCKRVYLLDDALGLGYVYLDVIAAEAAARGVDAIVCPDPLIPDMLAAVLLPSLSLGFVAGSEAETGIEPYRHVRLDAMVNAGRVRSMRPEIRKVKRITGELMDDAYSALREAKGLHDELERLYNPFVDFLAIRALAERHFEAAIDGIRS